MFKTPIDYSKLSNTLPAGCYPATIESVKRIRWVDGGYEDLTCSDLPETEEDKLALVFTIIGDSYNGKKVFINLSMWSKNIVAMNIGRNRFKQLSRACGKEPEVVTTNDLISQCVNIFISHQKNLDKDGEPYPQLDKVTALGDAIPFIDNGANVDTKEKDPFA